MNRPGLRAAVLLLAIAVAVVGQFLLPQQGWAGLGVAYFVVAGLAFIWVLAHLPASHEKVAPVGGTAVFPPTSSFPIFLRMGLALATVGLAVVAFFHLENNTFTRSGTLAWLGAMICFLLFAWEGVADWPGRFREEWRQRPFSAPFTMTITRHHLILLALLLLAAFFRFYRLDSLPAEMGSDQAEKLFDVYDVVERGLRPIFFPRNTGREAVQFYLTAGIVGVTGLPIGFLPLKMGTALVSLFAVPWVYLLAKELYGRSTAYLTTFFFAISAWHVAISRVGLRFPFTAAFATPTLYFFFRALKYNRRNDWLVAGGVLGVGLHTYIPMRIVPLLLVLLALLKFFLDLFPVVSRRWSVISKGRLHPAYRSLITDYRETSSLTPSFWQNAILGGLLSLLIFLPLLRYMRDDPDMFWYRVTSRSLENGGMLPSEAWQVFWHNVKNALLMFNYRGDAVVSNSIPYTPFLGWVSGGLFVLGVMYLLWQLVKWRDRRGLYMLLALFVLLLPTILSLEFPKENPSRVRAGGAIPWVVLIAALPLSLLWQQAWEMGTRIGRWVAVGVTAVLLLLATYDNYTYYFVRYDAHFHRTLWNTSEMGAAARGFANSAGDMDHVYHIPYPFWVDTRLIGIYAEAIPWENAIMDNSQIAQLHIQDGKPKLYILHLQDQPSLELLQHSYPDGWVEVYHSRYGTTKDFLLYFVPPR